jgi:uncharacterized protein
MNRNETATAVLVRLIGIYKRFLSPLLPPSCRFVPTCSEYAQEAIAGYGAVRGSAIALWRLLRCHPLAPGGFDPIPLTDTCLTRGGQRPIPGFVSSAGKPD